MGGRRSDAMSSEARAQARAGRAVLAMHWPSSGTDASRGLTVGIFKRLLCQEWTVEEQEW